MHFKIAVFIPKDNLAAVKEALFDAGAGKLGNYDRCSWQTLGTGQFRPLTGANPAIGEIGEVEEVEEYRLEVLCPAEKLEAAIRAMVAAHPYETPAYDVWKLHP